jgi:hypothetical protein
MSDDASAPPDPGAPTPATPPRISRPGGSAPVRPPTGKKPPPPPRPPSKVKAYLVYGIIISTVVLLGLIGWRVYVRLTTKVVPARNVKAEWENAWQKADTARKEIFRLESDVWVKGEELNREKIKAALVTLQNTSETYHELMDLMRKQGKLDSAEGQDIGGSQILLKTWIWDANGVIDAASQPPKYGGLYLPMYATEKRMDAAAKRLKEIRDGLDEVLARNNKDEMLGIIKEIRKLREELASCRDEFLRLDEELVKGLTLPDLTEQALPDLKELRDFTSKAVMTFKEAGTIRSRLPSEDELNAPPKEEPKPEPTPEQKEEPPKDEPKKEPPKEEPPKEEPKKEQKEEPKKDEPK